jgi:hypothetical protein
MRDRLADWDTHRRDFDRSGEYDDAQSPAIMDAWWPRLSHAMFDAASGNAFANLSIGLDDGNRRGHVGSAFQDGSYGIVIKDLRQVLGMPVSGSLSRTYCGGGDAEACKLVLWDALSDAAADLETEFADPNVENWKRAVADEDVRHTSAGIAAVPAIHWINRPTFQQVVETGSTQSYLCDRSKASGGGAVADENLTINGPLAATTIDIVKAASVCNAAGVGEGAALPETGAHLACYRARTASGAAKHRPEGAALRSSLGSGDVRLAPLKSVCLSATVDGESSGAADTFECFKAKFENKTDSRRIVEVTDVDGTRMLRVLRLDSVCIPAETPAGPILDPNASLACFKARRAPGEGKFAPRDAEVITALGTETQTLSREERLCVPAGVSLD